MIAALCLAGPAAAQSFGSPTHFTEQGGAAVYHGVCAGCHMADGRGAVGAGTYPSLVGAAGVADAGGLIGLLLRGRGGMPGFARTLSDEQIADVAGYVRTHFGNDFPAALPTAAVAAAR